MSENRIYLLFRKAYYCRQQVLVVKGIVQGSVLDPLLVSVFINDVRSTQPEVGLKGKNVYKRQGSN